jgi:hypothetical protein
VVVDKFFQSILISLSIKEFLFCLHLYPNRLFVWIDILFFKIVFVFYKQYIQYLLGFFCVVIWFDERNINWCHQNYFLITNLSIMKMSGHKYDFKLLFSRKE